MRGLGEGLEVVGEGNVCGCGSNGCHIASERRDWWELLRVRVFKYEVEGGYNARFFRQRLMGNPNGCPQLYWKYLVVHRVDEKCLVWPSQEEQTWLLSAPRPRRGCSVMEACKKKVKKGSTILKMRLLRGITMW